MVYLAVQTVVLCLQGSDVGPRPDADNLRRFILQSTAGRLAPLGSARDEDVCLSHAGSTV